MIFQMVAILFLNTPWWSHDLQLLGHTRYGTSVYHTWEINIICTLHSNGTHAKTDLHFMLNVKFGLWRIVLIHIISMYLEQGVDL